MSKPIRVISSLAVLAVMVLMLFVLSRQAGIMNKAEDINPPLFDTPSYIELADGQSLKLTLTPDDDISLGDLSVVIVNTDSSGAGSISFSLTEQGGQEIFTTQVPESDIPVGEWHKIGSPGFPMSNGQVYELTITAKDCSPYFIKTQKDATNRVLPFSEEVYRQENPSTPLGYGISLGTSVVSDKALTYGDIFYYSRMITVVLAIALILWIMLGTQGILSFIKKIPAGDFTGRAGSDIFLVILFVTLCLSIYINGYLEGINISADSAGYLREAANMAAGRGFHFDSLAGYDNSWFANWPILYPFFIAVVSKLTGLEVYAASKVLSMILVGILILVIRFTYKKDAWIYALLMTNLGLMYLYWYSWSELPFILFMVLFVLSLTGVLQQKKPQIKSCIFLGLSILLCFLTRYFGMFTFGVMGLFILLLVCEDIREKKSIFSPKTISLVVTSVISCILCVLYLLNNKIQNGMPSGVSRSMWWDDYESLTNDLIKALLAEIFNIFHLEVPAYIAGLSYGKSVLIVILVSALAAAFIIRNVRKYSRPFVFIMTGVIYYGMFIVIRYFSSMDTFYYRFFAPATFLITLGLAELIREKTNEKSYRYLLVPMALFLAIFLWSDLTDHVMKKSFPYYEIVQMSWDEDYAEIPERSVVIFSTLDYRSQFYRTDVVEGTISPDDTMDSLRQRYYGSHQMCILSGDAKAMLESGIYDESVSREIEAALQNCGKYCVISF